MQTSYGNAIAWEQPFSRGMFEKISSYTTQTVFDGFALIGSVRENQGFSLPDFLALSLLQHRKINDVGSDNQPAFQNLSSQHQTPVV